MMTRNEIERWLRETDAHRLETLWAEADRVRRECVGGEVWLRGLIEFSNHCARQCGYCGLRIGNDKIVRYRMTEDEVLDCAHEAVRYGYGTVVMQSGEDFGATGDWVAGVIRRIKAETPLAVTLSLGERAEDDLRLWREAGADRYLLRFETSNNALFDHIHPPLPGKTSDRLELLRLLDRIGYEVGSGVLIGIPGQRYEDLVNDILLFRELNLDMVGVGPYIPHPDTPLADEMTSLVAGDADQVPNTELMTYKVVALTRITCPYVNIPSTTALATLNKEQGRELGLSRGANVVMPNMTPVKYRTLYEIYPAKACVNETAQACQGCLRGRIKSIGRSIGEGRGDSPHYFEAKAAAGGTRS